MSVSWVPPGRTSPYQNGAEALEKPAALSSKASVRQVEAGEDASLLPLRKRHTELVEKTSVAKANCAVTAKIRQPITTCLPIRNIRKSPAKYQKPGDSGSHQYASH